MFFKYILIFVFLFSFNSVLASYQNAKLLYQNDPRKSKQDYYRIIDELLDDGYYFSTIPWLKELMINSRYGASNRVNRLLEKVISVIGVKQFETIDNRILKKSSTDAIQFVLAKKLFREKKYNSA
ncbi:MAG: hypothetical protein ACOCUT_02640, partial [bacterium]